MSDRIQH